MVAVLGVTEEDILFSDLVRAHASQGFCILQGPLLSISPLEKRQALQLAAALRPSQKPRSLAASKAAAAGTFVPVRLICSEAKGKPKFRWQLFMFCQRAFKLN